MTALGQGEVLEVWPLGFPWRTVDPFLFCAHHHDAYPAGNEAMGPAASLAGRRIGEDFAGKDGWNMYHGEVVPGFPRHPHRGFETVTIARRGLIDHSDSLGATARFGRGDVQWMTAGRGIVHAEMFPLVERDRPNPLELFQLWLNLPRADKMVEPHFAMLWSEQIRKVADGASEVTVIAGKFEGALPPAPPPHSWAAREEADVAIWLVRLDPGARLTLPPARSGTRRTLHLFRGGPVRAGGREIPAKSAAAVRADRELALDGGAVESELLVMQGRPIAEPVASYGPFVMNSGAEIEQAIRDYRQSEFGGWPWPSDGPVHAREQNRFAIHAGGRAERPR